MADFFHQKYAFIILGKEQNGQFQKNRTMFLVRCKPIQ